MALSDYTTPDEVRAVLGISAREVPDDKVASTVNLTTLLEALRKLSPTLSDDFKTAHDAAPRSALQTRFTLLVETFCAYTVAVAMVPSLPLSAPMIITDGKTALNRVSNPFEALLPSLNASLTYFKTNLMAAYAELFPGTISPLAPIKRTMVVDVGIAVDPVTGA